jgi:hypothetical protein
MKKEILNKNFLTHKVKWKEKISCPPPSNTLDYFPGKYKNYIFELHRVDGGNEDAYILYLNSININTYNKDGDKYNSFNRFQDTLIESYERIKENFEKEKIKKQSKILDNFIIELK